MEQVERGARIRGAIVGSAISVPTAIVVAFVYSEIFHKELPGPVAMAAASLLGSFVTIVAMCVKDLRRLFCSIVYHYFRPDRRLRGVRGPAKTGTKSSREESDDGRS